MGKPLTQAGAWLSTLAVSLGLPAWFYFRHVTRGHDTPVWLDDYGPLLLPAVLSLAVLLWGYDTFFGRVVTTKPATPERLKLIGKRVAVATATAAIIVLLQSFLHWDFQLMAIYRSPAAEVLVMAISALVVSAAFVQRPSSSTSYPGRA